MHRGMKLLVIEDDERMADFVVRGLKERGHIVDHASNGKDGLFLAASEKYDAMVIDRMLPDLDGLKIMKMLRAGGNHVPAIFLTTMAGIDDRVEGLEAGADDYLVKPFAFEELYARLGAVMRRPPVSDVRTILRVGEIELDLITRIVTRAGRRRTACWNSSLAVGWSRPMGAIVCVLSEPDGMMRIVSACSMSCLASGSQLSTATLPAPGRLC